MALSIERPDPIAGMEWTVLRGERESVMRALGAEHAEAIRAWREAPDGAWGRFVARAEGVARERFEAIVASSKRLLPTESAELEWIAEGAGLPALDLWAANLRGDLGRDGIGCSDVCHQGPDGVVMGHNEDGDGELAGLIRLITLDIDGEPSATVVWYPGMLPANSFVATSAGLAFGMDHVPVAVPLTSGAGRHLVARAAQRQANGRHARDVLDSTPCAGGFSFDVADGPGRVGVMIENAAGRIHRVSARERTLLHTNHLRWVDGTQEDLRVADDDEWLAESRGRARALEAAGSQARTADEAMGALRATGVLNGGDDIHTFATVVVDTANDKVLVAGDAASDAGGGTEVWRGGLQAFAEGRWEEKA